MTSRERVLNALARRPVDRVPVFLWFHPETAERLGRRLGIPAGRVGEAMGNDVRQAWVNNNYAMEGIVHERDGESHLDYWGIRWVKEGPFNQIAESPLAAAGPEAIAAYRFPEGRLEELLAPLAATAAGAGDGFLGADVSPCAFEMYLRLRGMEEALLDLAARPEAAAELIGRCAGFAAQLAAAGLDRFRLDWLWTGDDVAGQSAMLMSPAQWRRLIKPALARVVRVGRERGRPVAYHSCGAIRPIIPDLVEMGVTVLNPIQPNCPGMDPLELKREFGRPLTFMGGVDTQGLLVREPAERIYYHVRELIEGMCSDGGGYILAGSHTIPPETPEANIFAMLEAAGISREEIFDRAAGINP